VYEFQAVGTTAGSKEATVELILPDDNPDNDSDQTIINLYLTCGDPFGNSTRASCAPLEFVGPADKQLVLNGSTYKAQCCVSAVSLGTARFAQLHNRALSLVKKIAPVYANSRLVSNSTHHLSAHVGQVLWEHLCENVSVVLVSALHTACLG
jgi:hypothetical protein